MQNIFDQNKFLEWLLYFTKYWCFKLIALYYKGGHLDREFYWHASYIHQIDEPIVESETFTDIYSFYQTYIRGFFCIPYTVIALNDVRKSVAKCLPMIHVCRNIFNSFGWSWSGLGDSGVLEMGRMTRKTILHRNPKITWYLVAWGIKGRAWQCHPGWYKVFIGFPLSSRQHSVWRTTSEPLCMEMPSGMLWGCSQSLWLKKKQKR